MEIIKSFKKIYWEISQIGLGDWFWFVVYLKRSEFSYKLCLSRYYNKYGKTKYSDILCKDRGKAHHIDMILSKYKE